MEITDPYHVKMTIFMELASFARTIVSFLEIVETFRIALF
jgi:hypothetical protein